MQLMNPALTYNRLRKEESKQDDVAFTAKPHPAFQTNLETV